MLDHLTDSSFFTPIGLALGLILGTYLVIHRCVLMPQRESKKTHGEESPQRAGSESASAGTTPVVEGALR